MYTDTEIQELEHLYELRDIEGAKNSLLKLTEYLMPQFKAEGFHKVYYMVLDMFAKGTIKNLIITMPPQHGKYNVLLILTNIGAYFLIVT